MLTSRELKKRQKKRQQDEAKAKKAAEKPAPAVSAKKEKVEEPEMDAAVCARTVTALWSS